MHWTLVWNVVTFPVNHFVFEYKHLDNLFNGEGKTIMLWGNMFNPNIIHKEVEGLMTFKHIVLAREKDAASSYLDDQMILDEKEICWELRYLYKTSTGEKHHTWNASLFAWHCGGLFLGWWKSKRTSKYDGDNGFVLHDGKIPVSFWEEWNVVIYIHVKLVSFKQVQDQSLTVFGGQNQVFCDEHDVPLIVAPFRENNIDCCHTSKCKNGVSFQCPVDGCVKQICMDHNQSMC